jgi:hypothetical protein
MNDGSCWNCGHAHALHTIEGGCSFESGGEHCDCREYEDGEYKGEQRKRDTQTYSDMRRLNVRRDRR